MRIPNSLKLNAFANYIGLAYSTLIGLIVLPLYLKYLGAEAFGLVGLFTMLQAWMQLLDMGMSSLISRQAAVARGNYGFFEFRKLLRSLELVFLGLSLFVALVIYSGSSWIATQWIRVEALSVSDVRYCIALMGVMIGLRFFASLYRSAIRGMEKQVQLNIANTLIMTLKFVGALFLFQLRGFGFVEFFVFQLYIGIFELLFLSVLLYRLLPKSGGVGLGFFWRTLKPELPFVAGIAYTSAIWVLITQLDKLVLSNVLTLADYGYFSLVALVAGAITQVSSPIRLAILPRMVYLLSQNKEREMISLYRSAAQIVAVIIFPVTGMVALYSTELLYAWTGDLQAAQWGGPILFWFALGNGILAVGAFQYYLQYAHGNVRMHVIYNSITAFIQVPMVIFVALEYGAMGVALAWFFLRLVSFLIWTPIVHGKFAPGIHGVWLREDLAPILLCTAILLLLSKSYTFDLLNLSRAYVFASLIVMGFVTLLANAMCSRPCRDAFLSLMHRMSSRF